MKDGYIKLYRKLTEWEWYDDIPTCRLFVHLLLSANFEETVWRGIRVGRGQYLTTQVALRRETGLSEMRIRRALRNLINSDSVRTSVSGKKTIVTLCNYESYQAQSKQPYRDNNTFRNASASRSATPPNTRMHKALDNTSDTSYIYIEEEKKKKRKEISKEKRTHDSKGDDDESSDLSEKVYTGAEQGSGAEPTGAMPEEERKTKTRARAKSDEDVATAQAVAKLYNEAAERSNLPRCTKLTAKRVEAVCARAKEYGLETVREVIAKAEASNFLNGRARADFRASFDWIFAPANFVKILEGNYDNRPAALATAAATTTTTTNRNDYGHTTRDDADAARRERQTELANRIYAKLHGDDANADGNPEEIS